MTSRARWRISSASSPAMPTTCGATGRSSHRCSRSCWPLHPPETGRGARFSLIVSDPAYPRRGRPIKLRPMARITVEDCLENVENLFQLVLLAAQRARRLANGAEATLPLENDKPTVLALREIAAGNITAEMLREPEPAPEPVVPDADNQSTFRAPQFGLGD